MSAASRRSIDVIEFELAYSNKLGFVRRALVFLLFAWRSILVALREDYDVVFATTTPCLLML